MPNNQRLDIACSRSYPKAPESVPNALQPLKDGSGVERHKGTLKMFVCINDKVEGKTLHSDVTARSF